MPDRIFGNDAALAEHYTAKDLTGPEYAEGHFVEVKCKHCDFRRGLQTGDMGEVPAGARNPLLAHSAAHQGNGTRKVRPPIFKLPPVTP